MTEVPVFPSVDAILAFADAPIPRTHNLEDLQAQCIVSAPMVIASGLDALDLSDLTPFAVESRYDNEFWPDRAEAADAVGKAARVHTMASVIIEASRPDPPQS